MWDAASAASAYLSVLLPVPPSVAMGPSAWSPGLGCVDLWRLVCALFVAFVCAWSCLVSNLIVLLLLLLFGPSSRSGRLCL